MLLARRLRPIRPTRQLGLRYQLLGHDREVLAETRQMSRNARFGVRESEQRGEAVVGVFRDPHVPVGHHAEYVF